MAVMKVLHTICARVIRGLMKAKSLASHARVRIPDEEQGLMSHCEVSRKIQHQVMRWNQERVIYRFLKDTEDRCRLKGLNNLDEVENKRVYLILMSLMIVTREAHRDWFYLGQNCPNHIRHEVEISDDWVSVKKHLWKMEYGICMEQSEVSLREVIRNILNGMSIPYSVDVLRENVPWVSDEESQQAKLEGI
ncbi:hypothetical protein PG994_013400 [Apiospora phragmitis]|uniref:Uncharacterized protein n=1 Tax=Apiospora phragmitis TaxID=2905665 RepID=A0ABR1T8I6_9PEZI